MKVIPKQCQIMSEKIERERGGGEREKKGELSISC